MENQIIKMKTRTVELAGSSYEIGRMAGEMIKEIPELKAHHATALPGFDGGKRYRRHSGCLGAGAQV